MKNSLQDLQCCWERERTVKSTGKSPAFLHFLLSHGAYGNAPRGKQCRGLAQREEERFGLNLHWSHSQQTGTTASGRSLTLIHWSGILGGFPTPRSARFGFQSIYFPAIYDWKHREEKKIDSTLPHGLWCDYGRIKISGSEQTLNKWAVCTKVKPETVFSHNSKPSLLGYSAGGKK